MLYNSAAYGFHVMNTTICTRLKKTIIDTKNISDQKLMIEIDYLKILKKKKWKKLLIILTDFSYSAKLEIIYEIYTY